jgi:hypothetical protein
LPNVYLDALNFVSNVNENCNHVDRNIFNTDQSGFNLEMPSKRTLSHVGEKNTFAAAGSVPSTTHSYTVQYVISKSGCVLKKFMLCWQETSGKFGPRVSDEIQELSRMCPNVYICCSSSGKLTKSQVKNFITYVLKDIITNEFALILDSWSPQLNQDLYNQVFGPQKIEVQLFQNPPHCTPFVQPLDVFYFQQLKK